MDLKSKWNKLSQRYKLALAMGAFFLIPLILILIIHIGNCIFYTYGININPPNIDNKDWLTFLGVYITFWGTVIMGFIANKISEQSSITSQKIAELSLDLEKAKLKPTLRLKNRIKFKALKMTTYTSSFDDFKLFYFHIKPENYQNETELKQICSFDLNIENTSKNSTKKLDFVSSHIGLAGDRDFIDENFVLHAKSPSSLFYDREEIKVIIFVPELESYDDLNKYLIEGKDFVLDFQMEFKITNNEGYSYPFSIGFYTLIQNYRADQENEIDISSTGTIHNT